MPDIFELLNSDLGKQLITKTGNEAGISSEQTSEVLSMALPALMGAMQQNATSAQGAQSLLGALTSKHDGSILDNLGDLFQGGVNSDVLQDGSGILGHILGGKQTAIENGISKNWNKFTANCSNPKNCCPNPNGIFRETSERKKRFNHRWFGGITRGSRRRLQRWKPSNLLIGCRW